MKPFRFLRIIGVIFLLTAITNLFALAQELNPWLDAMLNHYAGIEVSGWIDSWGAYTPHSGSRDWGLGIHSTYMYPISNPTIEIINIGSGSVFRTFSGVAIPGGGNGWYGPGEVFTVNEDATLGFESSRTFDYLQIPAGATHFPQTMTVKVIPIDPMFKFPQEGFMGAMIAVWIDGPCEYIRCENTGTIVYGNNDPRGSTNIQVFNPVWNQPYTFTVVRDVDNPGITPIYSKPRLHVAMQNFHQFDILIPYRQSCEISDPSLSKYFGSGADGARFSTDMPDAQWHPRFPDENHDICYDELNTVTSIWAKSAKENVLSELAVFRATATRKQDGDKLDDAIKHLSKSLDHDLWIDETHLQSKHGEKVFSEEKDTVNKLRDLIKDEKSSIPKLTLKGFIDDLVAADKVLAQTAIDEASDGDSKEIAKANEEMTKALEEYNKGKCDDAIEHYKNAWKHAQHDE